MLQRVISRVIMETATEEMLVSVSEGVGGKKEGEQAAFIREPPGRAGDWVTGD